MSKVKTKKLSPKERKRLDKIPSEKDKTLKVVNSKKATQKEIDSIMEVVNRKKDKSKKEVKSKKEKSKSKQTYSAKAIKELFTEYDLPSILTTKELTQLIQDETGHILGQDLTAGGKNLRRYLRSLPQYDDGEMTTYRWSKKDSEDLETLAEILSHYSVKAEKLG